MRTNPLRCEAIRSAIRSAKNWLEPMRTATNCKELQRIGFIRIGSTDVSNSLNTRIGLANRWEPWDFGGGELTRSSTKQYASGESAGDLIRIHIRISSPSWFATVWLGHYLKSKQLLPFGFAMQYITHRIVHASIFMTFYHVCGAL